LANLELRNVTKIFDKNIKAVDSANISIRDTEFIVLVGPSGCGKSTLLRMIAGLEDISSGEIYIENKKVNEVPPKDRDIAMVFQNYALYPHMTVFQNMAFGLKLRKFSAKEIEKRVTDAADILGISQLLNRKPKALSGGQRQRVAVGRAIVRKPKVFLFDEPLSNLDAKLRVQMRMEISKLHTRLGSTMIYVTHDQVEAMTMGERIVVLKDGRIQQTDTPLELYNNPANKFVAGFIGSPAMNFIDGKIVKEDGLWFQNQEIRVKIPEGEHNRLEKYTDLNVTLGIRPEDLYEQSSNIDDTQFNVVTSKVEVVEPMGNEMYLYLNTGQHNIVARTKPKKQPEINSELLICLDMNKVHFFNTKTEKAI